ncbi:MAG TPA: bifunctional DNA-formamidopyrimidine glycosylase/DNA-(apurinic or apyrimidinic site) lyase [Phycisphaerales bacterium]|nr:bifunctional DNA-formamidopyrimidine glycosylase/DNA-(apurinic or apyrimidinic site) lyase [Phycisphaerales bacterium]
MPELPEVECVRRSLEPLLAGARVLRAELLRPDIVTGPARARDLLQGTEAVALRRHGKQLAILGRPGRRGGPAPRDREARVLLVHLGMTGQLMLLPAGASPERPGHVHARWRVRRPDGTEHLLVFRDPRRFGGLWTFRSVAELEVRWSGLGPDALELSARDLSTALAGTTRAVKAALLDQRVAAGIGNIYADESLHLAGIHPAARSDRLRAGQVRALARAIPAVLRRSIRAGGTTRRDYTDGLGRAGRAGRRLAVYGRAGAPCLSCGTCLRESTVAQRTTVHCPLCQPLRARGPAGPG